MRRGFQGAALRQFTRLFESGTLSAASDRELLDAFERKRDESAFDVLLTRYGRLVLNVGRKLLHDPRDVEDAFQATFLVLVRKPPRLRVGETLGPWMSTVAYRVAARARANRIRLNRMETTDGLEASAPTQNDAESNALVLHEELNRLPERLRRPVVCCYLEGLTHERAAERLGCPVGTVRSRLARARLLLHRRLVRRGVAPAVAPLEVMLSSSNAIEPPLRLINQTLRLATTSPIPWSEASVVSASLLSLVNGVVRMMNLKKALVAVSLALPLGSVVVVGAAQAYQQAAGERDKIVVDGRTYRAEPEGPKTFPYTYYVGDILGLPIPKPNPDQSLGEKPFDPIMKLIMNTIEPGTWEVLGSDGQKVNGMDGLKIGTRRKGERPIGSITPFLLSNSLIIRHTVTTHEQIADLLRNLREIVNPAIRRATTTTIEAVDAAPTGRLITPIQQGKPLDVQGEESDDYIRLTLKAPADDHVKPPVGPLALPPASEATRPPVTKGKVVSEVDEPPIDPLALPPAPPGTLAVKDGALVFRGAGQEFRVSIPNPNELRMMRMKDQLKKLQSEMEALEKDLIKAEPPKLVPVTPIQAGTPEKPHET